MTLAAQHLCKSFGEQCVLRDVSLTVDSGGFLAILGRSGCGKTTLLRLLGGFLPPDSGRVLLDGKPVTAPGKDLLTVFQGFDQLFPWQTLLQNLIFALTKTRPALSKKEARELASQCLGEMDLISAQDKYPHQLSGGMKQRGVLARAMALAPKVLLMDEPFSSLDVSLRENAHESLLTLRRLTGAAVIFVTHDIGEALHLAPEIALMKPESHGIFEIIKNTGTGLGEELARELRDSRGMP